MCLLCNKHVLVHIVWRTVNLVFLQSLLQDGPVGEGVMGLKHSGGIAAGRRRERGEKGEIRHCAMEKEIDRQTTFFFCNETKTHP